MDPHATTALFEQVHTTWIRPEIDRRRSSGSLPPDFKVYRAQILLPRGRPPVVAFNDEIQWMALVDASNLEGASVGGPVFWDQIRRFRSVAPPMFEGTRVAFVYLFKVTTGYQILFDASPNLDDATGPGDDWNEVFGPAIADTLQDELLERSVQIDQLADTQLRAIGLWPAPAIVPYPFAEIVRRVTAGDSVGARQTLLAACNIAFVRNLIVAWWDTPEFLHRRNLISSAIDAHGNGNYILSIHALLPQLEGLITDWMLRTAANSALPFRQESKTKRFRDLALGEPHRSFVFRKVVEASLLFILDGPVLASFQRWDADVASAFPNRHVVGHGRYEEAIYTEESSVKLILLLDSLHLAMTNRPLRSDDVRS